ncbi:unnamed protein product [Lymnaea stagnalis]|uniref:Glutamyl-tRNA(Gln) amidotransferase subunit B, mitochondrial n=1 Tax=Lymnaea stagnalis TaxID=6523 RepID=A0AAV2HT33_LYMST
MAASLTQQTKECIFKTCLFCNLFHKTIATRSMNIKRSHISATVQKEVQPEWQGVIGLEIHAQIKTLSKLFSGAATIYDANTNTQVAFFDAALPGTLPVLNQKCVQAGVMTALALGCDINLVSKFDRKHYFYADMPAGYQITQYRKPLAVNGRMTYMFQCSHNNKIERRSAQILQIQLEQDSGKSLHDPAVGYSLIDLNRAGIGLMEIVTAPDFTSGDDAASFVKDLRDILIDIGACDGKMAEGSLRVDANISVHRPGEPLGIRSEVKNINSFRNIRLAVDYEIRRQIQLLESGEQVVNETRSFDIQDGETVTMREKEKVLDYRFLPEPNLPPLVIHKDRSSVKSSQNVVVLEEVKSVLKELPDEKRKRLETKYNISLKNSVILVRANLAELFEKLVEHHSCDPAAASSVLRNSYAPFLDKAKLNSTDRPISDDGLAEIINIYGRGEISETSLGILLREKSENIHLSCKEIMDKNNLCILNDELLINAAIDDVCERNPKAVKAYKKGKTNQLEILSTKVKKKLDGKVASGKLYQLVKEKLQK